MIVTRLFPWSERKLLIAHLASFNWDFSLGKAVRLVQGTIEIHATQIGSGNHEGHATITLTFDGNWGEIQSVIEKMVASGGTISIEHA
jgi:hypothetical protein